jgi:hypothetical protein
MQTSKSKESELMKIQGASVQVHLDTFKNPCVKATVTNVKTKSSILLEFEYYIGNEKLYAGCSFLVVADEDEKIPSSIPGENKVTVKEANEFIDLVKENIVYLSEQISNQVKDHLIRKRANELASNAGMN